MTCEELLADIASCNSTISACDATIYATNQIKTAAQMQKWYDQYNFVLQECGDPPGVAKGEVHRFMVADEILHRTPAEMMVIRQCRPLLELHEQAVAKLTSSV